MKPNNLQMISHIAHHFGMPLAEVATILKVPTHPARMRDDFAALAMQGMLASGLGHTHVAHNAYIAADAMLAARIAHAAPAAATYVDISTPPDSYRSSTAQAADSVPANTAQWYDELLELLGASSQFEAKHLINELTAAKIDEAEARATVALYRALGVRDQEAALAKIKELTK